MQGPQAPSPTATAAAQTGSNISTATANSLLNQVNQTTPYGSLTYKQTGTNSYFDPTLNKDVTLPSFTANTTLSPDQQTMLDQQNKFGIQSNQLGLQQLGQVAQQYATPLNLNTATETNLDNLAKTRLDPQWQQNQQQFTQSMANQGLQPGSAAYDNASRDFNQAKNDAYNSMYLSGRSQAVNEALTQYNQPLNTANALRSGGQVSQPQFVNTPQTGVAGTDVAGLINNNYNQQNANYQANMGALGSLGSAALGGWMMSDERLKTDKHEVGETGIPGVPLESFRYKGSPLQHIGVMAQKLEKKMPEAVATTPSGYKAVSYTRLAQAMMRKAA